MKISELVNEVFPPTQRIRVGLWLIGITGFFFLTIGIENLSFLALTFTFFVGLALVLDTLFFGEENSTYCKKKGCIDRRQ